MNVGEESEEKKKSTVKAFVANFRYFSTSHRQEEQKTGLSFASQLFVVQ